VSAGDLKRAKREVRRRVLAARDALSEEERVAAALQVLDDDLPAGNFDLRVHLIVTPEETIRCEP
jgi:5-formyltetrahydrofolate cyclo-ligase